MSVQMHVISGFVGGTPETREAEPVWYRVTMWNGLGLTVAKYVDKSDFVVISSERLTASAWIDQDGNARSTLEITASSVDFSANRRSIDENTPVDETDIPF